MTVLRNLAISTFGWIVEKHPEKFKAVKYGLEKSDIKILLKMWVSMAAFAAAVSYAVSFVALAIYSLVNNLSLFITIVFLLFVPPAVAASVFALICFYPYQKSVDRRRSIDSNLPFALNHMAAIAGSGVPPYVIFKLLTSFGEYGEVSREAQKITRNIDTFGLDITTAMREVGLRTPSDEFKKILDGMLSVIETGGDLKEYLKVQSQEALFNYRLKRERYTETLATYADFYTALLIAAPMFLVAILAIMNMIGGTVAGMSIGDIMNLGIFIVLPVLNVGFIMFIHLTQPEI